MVGQEKKPGSRRGRRCRRLPDAGWLGRRAGSLCPQPVQQPGQPECGRAALAPEGVGGAGERGAGPLGSLGGFPGRESQGGREMFQLLWGSFFVFWREPENKPPPPPLRSKDWPGVGRCEGIGHEPFLLEI